MFEITIHTDVEHFRKWLRRYLSNMPRLLTQSGLSDEFDEGEIDGDTYLGIRAIDGQPRPLRGHPVTIRVRYESRDLSYVTIFHMSNADDGDFATFAGNLAEAIRNKWPARPTLTELQKKILIAYDNLNKDGTPNNEAIAARLGINNRGQPYTGTTVSRERSKMRNMNIDI